MVEQKFQELATTFASTLIAWKNIMPWKFASLVPILERCSLCFFFKGVVILGLN